MTLRHLSLIGCAMMASGIALGAFGAHGLRDSLEPGMLKAYETGVYYQMIHGFAILVLGVLSHYSELRPVTTRAAIFFVVSTVVFSGSLYLLSVTGVRQIGVITPFGGLGFILTWLWLGVKIFRTRTLA